MFWDVLDTVAVLLKIAALSKISALADTLAPAETLPVSVVMPDTTKLPVMLELPPTARVVLILAKPVDVMPVELAMKLEPTVCEAAFTVPVWNAPRVLAIKLVPTVRSAELTDTEALANPVIVVLPAPNVVIPDTAPENVPLVVASLDNVTVPVLAEITSGAA